MKKTWKRVPLGPLQTNCYIYAKENGECLIFDPGEEAQKLIGIIREKGWKPAAILLTHAHFDHIGAVDAVRESFDIPVYLHKKEADWLSNPALNGSQYFQMGPIQAKEADELITEEGMMEIGGFTFEILHTPGHSPGSLSFYDCDERIVFSGDALFRGSIGRTDLPGGSHEQLLTSIKTKLMKLPSDTLCLSGHGPETILEDEMNHNPFLQ